MSKNRITVVQPSQEDPTVAKRGQSYPIRLLHTVNGILIVGLVLVMVPFMIDILNFIFKVHFYDTFIAYYHYDIFSLGLGHFIEVISLLALVNLVIVFTLTYHINILDPVDIITGR